ncbi:hypothetical protein PpBr36_03494 [Pyricularia pennisetigena]|uniref:hypothetical protein n=1 Tax=Pyricularia pennisetigena TaxID=1578925 RepID=UPI0011542B49|nr:hypothetical protein PpBr36_03494 [Pyricularia pennisetigena]TLS31006.1 hypothetical protein PpBr36_03494 [Pyricularia pennisetigena]
MKPPCLSLGKIWDEQDHGGHAQSWFRGGEHQNKYTTGVMCRHNVVLALSSGVGKPAMNSLTSELTARFTGIKLLVTLVQYDFGKHVLGRFITTASVKENPHPSVRPMVVAFQTEGERDRPVDSD